MNDLKITDILSECATAAEDCEHAARSAAYEFKRLEGNNGFKHVDKLRSKLERLKQLTTTYYTLNELKAFKTSV